MVERGHGVGWTDGLSNQWLAMEQRHGPAMVERGHGVGWTDGLSNQWLAMEQWHGPAMVERGHGVGWTDGLSNQWLAMEQWHGPAMVERGHGIVWMWRIVHVNVYHGIWPLSNDRTRKRMHIWVCERKGKTTRALSILQRTHIWSKGVVGEPGNGIVLCTRATHQWSWCTTMMLWWGDCSVSWLVLYTIY
jgi:hypothetical protein